MKQCAVDAALGSVMHTGDVIYVVDILAADARRFILHVTPPGQIPLGIEDAEGNTSSGLPLVIAFEEAPPPGVDEDLDALIEGGTELLANGFTMPLPYCGTGV